MPSPPLATPRMYTSDRPGPKLCIETLGISFEKSSKSCTFISVSFWLPRAWMLIGTSCMLSERFCAVTITSSSWPRGAACWASDSGLSAMIAAASGSLANAEELFFLMCFIGISP